MEIDSLVISLGLDPSKLQAALEQVEAAVQQGQQTIIDFVQDIQDGFQEAAEEVAEGSAQGIETVGNASAEMVNQFEEAVNRFSDGVDRLGQKSQQAAARAKAAGGEVQALGRTIGRSIRGIISTVAAPLAGALSAGAIIGSYMGDVAQVAQMTGRYSTQMEEWRKKRELLSRINREDVELYRKGKLALLDFNFAMSGLSTTVMRALSPAIRFGIGLLTSLADWIRRNEPNIIRFFAVLAGTVTATLVPAFAKLGKAMLMNPLTWIIAGILLLALVIDSLVTYIRGGESALDGLWSQFGTGEEILEKLKRIWESFLGAVSRFKALIPSIVAGATAFAGYKAVIGTVTAVTKGINFLKSALAALRVVAATNPLGLFLFALAALIVYFDDIVAFFKDFRKNIGDLLTVIGEGIKNLLPDWLKDFLGVGSEGSQKADAVAKAATGGDKEAQQAFDMLNGGWGSPFALPPTNAELTQAAVPVSATTNNTKNVRTDIQNNVTLNMPPGSDPQAYAEAVGGQMQRSSGQMALVAEGGVRP